MSMALKFLMGLIVCVWLDTDARAQGGGKVQNPPCCSLRIPEGLVDDVGRSIPPISVVNPPRFITCPNTNPPVAAWCTKSKEPLSSYKTPCDIYGGSSTFGTFGDVLYDCTAMTTLDFCDGKFAGVELKKTDGTWGFCAPKAGSESQVSPRAESPILGYAEGHFYRFSCQPNAAENSECDYVKDPAKTRYPYLAVKEGEPDAKKGECVTRPDFACTAVMGHGRRWKDPLCRSAHGARTPPAWNSADLGQYTGPVTIGTATKHRKLFYSHTGMPARVKVCMPKSAGGTGGGGGGGGNGGGNTIACTLGPCGGKTNGVPNGCPGVSVSTPTGCGCSSDGKPPCNGGGTGGGNTGGNTGSGGTGGGNTGGGPGSGGSGSGGGNGGNGSDGSRVIVCPTITCPRGQQQNPLTCECELSNNGGSNGGGPSAGGGANGNNGTGGGAPAGGGITVVIIPPSDNPLERLSGGRGNPASGGAPAPNFDRSRR